MLSWLAHTCVHAHSLSLSLSLSLFQEHYLPHIMHSKLKLACSGLDDPNFSNFLDKALQDSKQRALLESEYCTELALYSILKDDLDRARYYTGLCLQSFLQVHVLLRNCKLKQFFVWIWVYERQVSFYS